MYIQIYLYKAFRYIIDVLFRETKIQNNEITNKIQYKAHINITDILLSKPDQNIEHL